MPWGEGKAGKERNFVVFEHKPSNDCISENVSPRALK